MAGIDPTGIPLVSGRLAGGAVRIGRLDAGRLGVRDIPLAAEDWRSSAPRARISRQLRHPLPRCRSEDGGYGPMTSPPDLHADAAARRTKPCTTTASLSPTQGPMWRMWTPPDGQT